MAGGLNLYGYAGGDPVNFSDPFGLCTPWPECVEGFWDDVAVAGHMRGGLRGKATATFASVMGAFYEYSGVETASAGADRLAGGEVLPGLAMMGLFVAGNLPGGGAADDVAKRLVDPDGTLRVSQTVARQLSGERSFIPSLAILETVRGGARVADPQGVPGHFMYRIGAESGTLEVLVDETKNIINHVLYRSN